MTLSLPGFRQFREQVRHLLQQIGIRPDAATDGDIIQAWLQERTAAEFAFSFAEQYGAIQLDLRGGAR